MMPAFKIAPLNRRAARAHKKKSFKRHLLNHWSKFHITSHECSPRYPLSKLLKLFCSTEQEGRKSFRKEIFQKASPPESLVQLQNNFTELFLLIPSTKIWQTCFRSTEQNGPKAPDRKYLQKASPPEPMVQIQNNFTELFLIIPSTNIAQMVLLH